MEIKKFEFNLFGENTYIIYGCASDPKAAAVIDPGMMDMNECDIFAQFVKNNGLEIKYLLNTHLHVDHLAGDFFVEETYGVGLSASADDLFLGDRVNEQVKMFGLRIRLPEKITIAHPLRAGDVLHLGDEEIKVLAVPGHSPGSLAFWMPTAGAVFTGDALFAGSIGRTDLPGGNYKQLITSITDNLMTLPPETVVYPGHGPSSTIAREEKTNPYI